VGIKTLGNGITGNQFLFNSSVGIIFGAKSEILGNHMKSVGVNNFMSYLLSSPFYQFSSNGLSYYYEKKMI
jgi:hypothetical protein